MGILFKRINLFYGRFIMKCANCGTENPDNAAHCGECGAALTQPAQTIEAASHAEAAQVKARA
ncbi:MAG: zinc ribbon domain-containing protein, partial [Clostridia bacterium]|nr:zinc ribbon domain-containing protein [Clostridia bacterium]